MSTIDTNVTVEDAGVQGTGGRLFVRIWSPGASSALAAIILFHDSLGSVTLWRDFPEALCAATGRRVIAYDRLGFGRSDANAATLPVDFVAREAEADFAALRQQLDIDRFILLGHSVGGGMAVHCAARFGEACEALVTVSAQAFVEERTIRAIEDARVQFEDPEQIKRLAKYHGEKARWVLDAWINSWLHPAFASWSLRSVLPKVTCPVLVIHGADDEYGSSRHPELIAALVGGPVRLEIMDDTQHMPHREKASEAIGMIAGFMQSFA